MTHLFYEPDALIPWRPRGAWDPLLDFGLPVVTPTEVPAKPNLGASEREYRAYNRASRKPVQERRQLLRAKGAKGYIEYKKLVAKQEQLRQQDFGAPVILDALRHFPELAIVSMSLDRIFLSRSPYMSTKFKAGLCEPSGDHGHSQPWGVPQLRSLLLGSHHAGNRLTKLTIGDVNWRFLQDEADNMNMMKESLRHLRVLNLNITTIDDAVEHSGLGEMASCRNYLASNALHDFIMAAPDLDSLLIGFDFYMATISATELRHIVRDHRWTNLKRVEFGKMDATQADLANFFSRHASTLRHLGLKDIRLLGQGELVPTLEHIRKTLSLESATLRHSLCCEDPPQYWALSKTICRDPFQYETLGPSSRDEDDGGDLQRLKTSEALSHYLVHGGSCPLLDEENHPLQPEV